MDSILQQLQQQKQQDEALVRNIHNIVENGVEQFNGFMDGFSDTFGISPNDIKGFSVFMNDKGLLKTEFLRRAFQRGIIVEETEQLNIEDLPRLLALLGSCISYTSLTYRLISRLKSSNYIIHFDFKVPSVFDESTSLLIKDNAIQDVSGNTPRDAFKVLLSLEEFGKDLINFFLAENDVPNIVRFNLIESLEDGGSFDLFFEALKAMDSALALELLSELSPVNKQAWLSMAFMYRLGRMDSGDMREIPFELLDLNSIPFLEIISSDEGQKPNDEDMFQIISLGFITAFAFEFCIRNDILQKLPANLKNAIQKEIDYFWSGAGENLRDCFEKDYELYSQLVEADKKSAEKADKPIKTRGRNNDEAKQYLQYATRYVDKKALIDRLVDENWVAPYDTESPEEIKKHLSFFFYDDDSPQDVSPDYKIRWNKHHFALNLLIRLLFNRNKNAGKRENIINEEGGINNKNIDKLEGKTWPFVAKVIVGAPKMRYAYKFCKERSEKDKKIIAELVAIANIYFDCKEAKEKKNEGN